MEQKSKKMQYAQTYKIGRRLGQGKFGVVYQATDSVGRTVAVKRCSEPVDKEISYQILREIGIMKQIHHPNIIQLYNIIMDANRIDIVMEYGGENLRTIHLTKGERLEHLRSISFQLINGCIYLHKSGIFHRDIKPDNVLVSWGEHPSIKICDFGVAKKIPPFYPDFSTHQLSTLCYRPPELFTDIDHLSSQIDKIDVWSIGCTLYEFAAEEIPFPGQTDYRVLRQILQKVPTTEEDLQELHLDNIKLDACNTNLYHKMPWLYQDMKLMEFKEMITSMLTLNPKHRPSLRDVMRCKYISSRCTEGKVFDDFFVRQPHKLQALRTECVDYIISLKSNYRVHDQTIFMSINLLDKYMAACPHNSQLRTTLPAVTRCCAVLASKFVDVRSLLLENFVSHDFPFEFLVETEREV
jgi:cyclin-dependent kinase 2